MKDLFARIGHFLRREPNLHALFSAPEAAASAKTAVSQAERQRIRNYRNFFFFLFYPLAVFYMEVVFHFAIYGEIPVKTLVYLALFSFACGFLLSGIALLLPLRANRVFTLITFTVITLLLESQYIYFRIFNSPYRVATMGMGGAAIRDFRSMLLAEISTSWFAIVLLLLPLLYLIAHRKDYRPAFSPTFSFRIYLLAAALLLHFTAVGIISLDRSDFGDRHYYKHEFSAAEAARRFGVLTDMRLDVKFMLFGEDAPEDDDDLGESVNPFETKTPDPVVTMAPSTTADPAVSAQTTAPVEPPAPIEYGDNVMDIDFDALIANETDADIVAAHKYFASLTPTKQNEYTGMFKGKNLIYITLEGFSYKTIDPERTPTLYKMANEGIVFKNFYTSLWGGSTATGEYTSMTGLFYNSSKCLQMSGDNLLPFTMGNQFQKLGYKTYAFHNHDYTYYSRNESHPNMGYEFIAVGNGLEGLTNAWPKSDYEMAVVTMPYYIDSETPFHAYYMTVSGHANYSFYGNSMSKKHQDIVADLDCSDNVKAYHACQYEVELMLAEMVRRLEAAGKLEDTVFVMSTDHYPYALSDAELAELYGIPEAGIHKNFDLLRNGCIIWCASMEEPIIVEEPCSSLDIIPTVSNLFGLEYDSRLLMGTDVLSDSVPLVILNQDKDGSEWNWINKYGEYNRGTQTFTPYEGFNATEEEINTYVKQINAAVSRKNKYSRMILEKDYYRYLFK